MRLYENYIVANTFRKRLIGWMGKKYFTEQEALLLFPCNSIHTCLMRGPIDVVFLNRQQIVVHVIHHMVPWRVSSVVGEGYYVLESKGGTLPKTIKKGDKVTWTEGGEISLAL